MLFKSSTAVAFLAVAAQAVAEPKPYMVKNARKLMSTREMFGVISRDLSDAYAPSETLCGLGDSCAEACGTGYATCQSTDNAIHCYNTATQVCCPDNSGNSCDAGYYCAGGTDLVVCCPDGLSLDECTKAYGLDKALTSEVVAPTSSSSAAPSSSSTTTTSSSSSSSSFSSSSSIVSSSIAPNTTSSSILSTTTALKAVTNHTIATSWGTGTGVSTTPLATTTATAVATAGATNNFTSAGGPSPAASTIATSAAGSVKAAGAAVALLAAGFALLL